MPYANIGAGPSATPEQIEELVRSLSKSLPGRLKSMPSARMQRLIAGAKQLVIDPVATLLHESFDPVAKPSVFELQPGISLPGVPACTLGDAVQTKIKGVTIQTHHHPQSFPQGLSLATAFPLFRRRRVTAFRSLNWLLRHNEFIAIALECAEVQVPFLTEDHSISPLQAIDLIRRSEKGEYVLSRKDGVQNFVIISDGQLRWVCSLTPTHTRQGINWFVSFDTLGEFRRYSNVQYLI